MKRTLIPIAGLALLLPACTISSVDASGATVGGSEPLTSIVEGAEPFYDAAIQQALVDSRLVQSERLGSNEPTATPDPVIDGTVQPIGWFLPPRVESLSDIGRLEVGTWETEASDGSRQFCFGYQNGDYASGSRCTLEEEDNAEQPPIVFWELSCEEDERDRWLAFTIDERVDALRFDMQYDVSIVGHDPLGTGLVAVEGIGTVATATAQTETGEVWTIDMVWTEDIAADFCETGPIG